jgi:hypothetical protein
MEKDNDGRSKGRRMEQIMTDGAKGEGWNKEKQNGTKEEGWN